MQLFTAHPSGHPPDFSESQHSRSSCCHIFPSLEFACLFLSCSRVTQCSVSGDQLFLVRLEKQPFCVGEGAIGNNERKIYTKIQN